MKGFRSFRKIVFTVFIFCCGVDVVQASNFYDVASSNPNAAAIDYLSKEGIISGYEDGTFRPESAVNRAEALKIMLLASGVEIQNPASDVFPDVPANAWFAPFIFSAKNSAIVDGYLDGNFRPAQTVNLVEALKILLNTNFVALENYATDSQLFADSEKNAWYNDFLLYAKTFEIIEPNSANQVSPGAPLTRGALAEIVFRFRMRVENVCPLFLENATTLPTNYFRDISLAETLPNIFYEREIFAFVGSTTEGGEMTAVLENRDDEARRQFSVDIVANSFNLPVAFGAPGHYNFSLIPSAVSSNAAATIAVLPRECAPATIAVSGLPPAETNVSVAENKPTVSWADADNNIFRVVVRQNGSRVEKLVSGGQNSVALDPVDFENFSVGPATAQVFGAKSENGFSYEPRTSWFGGSILELNLGEHHFSTIDEDKVAITDLPNFFTNSVYFSAVALTELQNEIYLILPDGTVSSFEIRAGGPTIAAGETFSVDFGLPTQGVYFLEINSTDGIAALNHPLYLPNTLPLLPDFADLREPPNPNRKVSLNRERSIWLRLVNDFRLSQNLSPVSLDEEISAFAQNYANTMAEQDFFGHVDSVGRSPEERRIVFGLQMSVGENLARDSTTENAHAGLLRSAAHRQNLLNPDWTRVGLGVSEVDNNLIFVEEFSADQLTSANLGSVKNEIFAAINSRRTQKSLSEFVFDGSLDSVAQGWSEKMVAQNFVDFQNNEDSLEKNIRAIDQTSSFMSFLISASQLSQIPAGLSDSIVADETKSRIAIGLAMDAEGRLIATFVFR